MPVVTGYELEWNLNAEAVTSTLAPSEHSASRRPLSLLFAPLPPGCSYPVHPPARVTAECGLWARVGTAQGPAWVEMDCFFAG